MRTAVIDIGSNTTRLLVAEVSWQGERPTLHAIAQDRDFTRLGASLSENGEIPEGKLAELVEVTSRQRQMAAEHGCERPTVVATAAIRDAANRDEVLSALERGGVGRPRVLGEREEAEAAFLGAVSTFEGELPALVGVVDVGGGSTEVVVGSPAGEISWHASRRVGSSTVAESSFASDPPSPAELAAARRQVQEAFDGIDAPRPDIALAVGGSATSLRQIAGDELDRHTVSDALRLLVLAPADRLANRLDLDPVRVRLLPAGLVILETIQQAWNMPLKLATGGIREGIAIEEARKDG